MCKCKDFFFLYDRFIHSRSLHYELYTYDLVYHLRSWIYFRFYGWITKFDNKNTTKIIVDIKINLKYLILQLVPVDSKPRPLRYKSQTINRTPILTSHAVIFISFRKIIFHPFHINCRCRKKISLQNKCHFSFILQFIFLLVEIGIGVWVITFLYRKHAKLNDFLICVQKSQMTLIMKQREYCFIYSICFIISVVLGFVTRIKKTINFVYFL